MSKVKNHINEIFVLILVLALLLNNSQPEIYPDSQRYLNGSLHDPPLYSSIIFALQFIFQTLNAVTIFQTLFIGFGVIYFSRVVT
ncbi:hypothetical protein N9M93_04265, partial [Candidatus Pelagibacter bacterium]|nr:hypothetical protein [Candidatus Pelagibacter bacterium]